MARNADNDNLTRLTISSDSAAVEDWMAPAEGNAAIAITPEHRQDSVVDADQPDDDTNEFDPLGSLAFDYPDEPLERTPPADARREEPPPIETAPADVPLTQTASIATGTALTTIPRDPSRQQLAPYMVTDAVSLARLGLSLPKRPVPQSEPVRQLAEQQVPPPPPLRVDRGHADQEIRVSSRNAHLFNHPPPVMTDSTALDGALPGSIASRRWSMSSVTSQPGFVVGLILSAAVGAGYYTYLI
ncbi:MAG: hypothetical protein ACR2PA_24205 [Hyphomicrobiaceae bacterium]